MGNIQCCTKRFKDEVIKEPEPENKEINTKENITPNITPITPITPKEEPKVEIKTIKTNKSKSKPKTNTKEESTPHTKSPHKKGKKKSSKKKAKTKSDNKDNKEKKEKKEKKENKDNKDKKNDKEKKIDKDNKEVIIIDNEKTLSPKKTPTKFVNSPPKQQKPIKLNSNPNLQLKPQLSPEKEKTSILKSKTKKGILLNINEIKIEAPESKTLFYFAVTSLNIVSANTNYYGNKFLPHIEIRISIRGIDILKISRDFTSIEQFNKESEKDKAYGKSYDYFHSTEQIAADYIEALDANKGAGANRKTITQKFNINIRQGIDYTQENIAEAKLSIVVENKGGVDELNVKFGAFDANLIAILRDIKQNGPFKGFIPIFTSKMFTVGYLRMAFGYSDKDVLSTETSTGKRKEESVIDGKELYIMKNCDLDYEECLSENAFNTMDPNKKKTREKVSLDQVKVITNFNAMQVYADYKSAIQSKNALDLYLKVLIPLNQLKGPQLDNLTVFFDEYAKESVKKVKPKPEEKNANEEKNKNDENEKKDEKTDKKNEDNDDSDDSEESINESKDSIAKDLAELEIKKCEDFIVNTLSPFDYNIFISQLLFRFLFTYSSYSLNHIDFSIRRNFPLDCSSLILNTITFIEFSAKRALNGKEIEEFKEKNEQSIICALKLLIVLISDFSSEYSLNLTMADINTQKKLEEKQKHQKCRLLFDNVEIFSLLLSKDSFYLKNSDIVSLDIILIRKIISILNIDSKYIDVNQRGFLCAQKRISFLHKFRFQYMLEGYHRNNYLFFNVQIILFLATNVQEDATDFFDAISESEIKYLLLLNGKFRLNFTTSTYKLMNNLNLGIVKNILGVCSICKNEGELSKVLIEEFAKYYSNIESETYQLFIEEKIQNFELHFLITEIGFRLSKLKQSFDIFMNQHRSFNIDLIDYMEVITKGNIDVNEASKDNYIYHIHKQRGKKASDEDIAQVLMKIFENTMKIWIYILGSDTGYSEELRIKLGIFKGVEELTSHFVKFEMFLESFKVYSNHIKELIREFNYQLDQ